MARKKKRKGKVKAGVFRVLRYVLIAVVAVVMGYGAGQLAIRVITARLGGPAPTHTQADNLDNALEQSSAATPTSNTSSPGSSASNHTPTSSSGTTGAGTAPVGGAVAAPPTPTPAPATTPQSSQTNAAVEAVPAIAAPKPVSTGLQPETNAAATELWRVRLGRFETREAAEAALEQVRATIPQAYVIFADKYQIQAGAFTERSRAVAFLNELSHLNLSAQIVSAAP